MLASDVSVEEALADVRVSLATAPADLLLRDCQLVNVWSEEVYAADIAVRGSRIVAVRSGYDGEAKQIVACEGRFVLPGFVEPRLDLPACAALHDSASALLSRGVTSIILPEARMGGGQGTSPRLWQETTDRRRRSGVDGFARALQRDRRCTAIGDAMEAISQGESVILDLDPGERGSLLKSIAEGDVEIARLMLSQVDLNGGVAGAIEFRAMLPAAVASGLSPVRIAQLTGFNAATHFGIEHLVGSVSPGRLADILIFETLESDCPAQVYLDGRKVAEHGQLV